MKQIIMQLPVQQPIYYPIYIEENLFTFPEKWLSPNLKNKKLVILTDETVQTIYAPVLLNALKAYNPLLFSFEPGEKSKTIQTKCNLEKQMLQSHCNRDTVILAVGGGVVGDMAGFIAATYMRGIPYVQIPTTLLAMVDSSVGGKTGINTDEGKNLIGASWQPAAVVIDVNCLISLPQMQLINGLIEAVKMFMTSDVESFNYLHAHIDSILQQDMQTIKNIIQRAILIKVAIVSADEKENHRRMILNFGHTIGHALEKSSDYTILHGYAVALGILVETKISQLLGFVSDHDYQTICVMFLKLGISGAHFMPMDSENIIAATKFDKKNHANQVRYILLKKIGEICETNNAVVHPVEDAIVRRALHEVKEILKEV